MVFSHYISYGMHRARHCRQNAIWTSFGASWPSIRTPKRLFELVLEEAAALVAASDVQWQIYASQQTWHLERDPLYHGHVDGKIILIRAAQGHSGARVNISLFTRELSLDDADLPTECVHGTQSDINSIVTHGLIPGGITSSGETPIRARDMVHFAVSRPSRPRGLPQLAALHRHRRFLIRLNLRAWLDDNRRAWLTENDVLLIRDTIPAGFFLQIVDQVTGRDLLPNFRIQRYGPHGPEPERAPAEDRLRGPITRPEPAPKKRPPPLPPPSIAEPESIGVGETATELEPEVEEGQEHVILVDLSEDEPEPDEEIDEIPNITMGVIELAGGRLRGPEPHENIDDTWNTESVNLVVAKAHPNRRQLITVRQDPHISFISPVPVLVIWSWLKDIQFDLTPNMPFRGDDSLNIPRTQEDAAFVASSSSPPQQPTTSAPDEQEVDPLSDYRGLINFPQAQYHRPAAFAADTQRNTLQLSFCFLNLGNLSRPARYPTRHIRSRDATRSILL